VIVPGIWTVQRGHQLLERIEADLRGILPNVTLFTHLESLNDPDSWNDLTLDREETPSVDTPAKPQQASDENTGAPIK